MEVMRWWTYEDWLMGIDDLPDRETMLTGSLVVWDYVNGFSERELWELC